MITRSFLLGFEKKLHGLDNHLVVSTYDHSGNKISYRETRAILADPNLFRFFSIPLSEGNKQSVLERPNSVVLSETLSKKYFGNEAAIGKTVYVNDSTMLQVTGVFRDIPHNSHFRFDMVLSVVGKTGSDVAVWDGWGGYCYFKLSKGYSYEMFQHDLDARKASLYAWVKEGCPHCDWSPLVQPLTEIVFTDFRGNTFTSKSKFLVEVVYVTSFVILILGWINYITLSVHSLKKRLSEWATRKVVGANRKDISVQLLVESITINTISMVAALTMIQITRIPAEQLLGLYIPTRGELSVNATVVIILVFLLSILFTSMFPLLAIQKMGITESLKGSGSRAKPTYLKAGLVTAQYVIAVVLLTWVVATNLQLNHILKKDIGLRKHGILVIDGSPRVPYDGSELSSFMATIRKIEGVMESTVSHSLVGEPDVKGTRVYRPGYGNYVGTDTNGGVDEYFLKTYQINLLAGRNFLPDNPADKSSVLISKALAGRLGFTSIEDAIGDKVTLPDGNVEHAEIIGVISDYEFRPYFNDMTERCRGVILTYKNYLLPAFKPLKISVLIDMGQAQAAIEQLGQLHTSHFPDDTFRWYWLEERIAGQYHNERIARNQITLFTVLAVGLACLGMLGMLNNVVTEKTKEIGIRKVMGARLHHIVHLLLNSTFVQVAVAAMTGIPVAYYLVRAYLEKFAEQIPLQWWHFALPIGLLTLIMFSTIAVVIWKAATRNPVEALKYE
jgi:putative ABC transport system permease protein